MIGDMYVFYFDFCGRVILDILVQGFNFNVIDKGYNLLLLGMSVLVLVVVGIVGLLNVVRYILGLLLLGFLNLWLYNNLDVFIDVVVGVGVGC